MIEKLFPHELISHVSIKINLANIQLTSNYTYEHFNMIEEWQNKI